MIEETMRKQLQTSMTLLGQIYIDNQPPFSVSSQFEVQAMTDVSKLANIFPAK
jgi:hypothetical protein